ncbi:hypothetical protein [Streptomyces sp. NPDC029526]|uniref:hypothetical protein n=1 Tax=Streptomyces sp. NPDC029526 TaxID=3155728 RepID=UPI0033FEEB83
MSESVDTGTGAADTREKIKAEASATAGHAKEAAGQVAGTAAEQARTVAGEARRQAGSAVRDLRGRAVEEADGQARRAAGTLRQWAGDLSDLADHARHDSAARGLAAEAAGRSHRAADYLEQQGVEGLVADLQGFARRRPGTFLGGALLAGLVVGRLVKASGNSAQAGPETSADGAEASAPAALPSGPPPAVPPGVGSLPTGAPPNGAPSRPHPGV